MEVLALVSGLKLLGGKLPKHPFEGPPDYDCISLRLDLIQPLMVDQGNQLS